VIFRTAGLAIVVVIASLNTYTRRIARELLEQGAYMSIAEEMISGSEFRLLFG
jgi:hypothetical protein